MFNKCVIIINHVKASGSGDFFQMIGNFLRSVNMRRVDTRIEMRELADCGKRFVGPKVTGEAQAGGGSFPHCFRDCEVVILSVI